MGGRVIVRTRNNRRVVRAFTLLEMLVTVAIIAIVAVMVIPGAADDSRLRLAAASAVIISDIEYAQAATLANPEQPLAVVFQPGRNLYFLADAAAPGVPVTRPDTGDPYVVTIGIDRAAAAEGVSFTVTDMPSNMLVFQAQGGLDDFTISPVVRLAVGATWLDVSISPTTGQISESAGTDT